MPGKEWLQAFLGRHKDVLANRVARNVSISKAAVDREVLDKIFDNLERELENVPATNIWNSDEASLGDDPGAKKVRIRHWTKYPEQIKNSTKACTSLIIAVSAAGKVEPVCGI